MCDPELASHPLSSLATNGWFKLAQMRGNFQTLRERQEEASTGGKKLKIGGGINLITGNCCVRVPFLF